MNFGTGDPNVQEGAYSARVGAGVTTAQANDWILSRGINLTSNQTVDISFYVSALQTGSTTPARYILTAGTTQNLASQSTIATSPGFTNTTFQINNYSYTAPTAGVYYFGLQNAITTNAAGSVFWAVDNFTVSSTTASIDEINARDFVIYPNPANEIIYINSENQPINDLSVIDINGREVMAASFENVLNATLDISSLSSGIYLITIESNQKSVVKK